MSEDETEAPEQGSATTQAERTELARRDAMDAIRALQRLEWQLVDGDPAQPSVEQAIHALNNARHLLAGGSQHAAPHPDLLLHLESR